MVLRKVRVLLQPNSLAQLKIGFFENPLKSAAFLYRIVQIVGPLGLALLRVNDPIFDLAVVTDEAGAQVAKQFVQFDVLGEGGTLQHKRNVRTASSLKKERQIVSLAS